MSTVDNAFECVPQDAMGSSAPSHDVGKSPQPVVVAQDAGEVEKVGSVAGVPCENCLGDAC